MHLGKFVKKRIVGVANISWAYADIRSHQRCLNVDSRRVVTRLGMTKRWRRWRICPLFSLTQLPIKRLWMEEDDLVVVAQTSMQGWRRTMEDVAVVWLKIPGDTTGTRYFAIFDGHGGTSVAEYAGTFLIHNIMNQPEWTTDLKEAIRKGYVECDQQLREEKDPKQLISGSTALTLFIRGNQIYCGNIGDSRAVASENDQSVSCLTITNLRFLLNGRGSCLLAVMSFKTA
uniref:PPM-type phosphatase domain-containing protein n=1 Tax=Lygus hesperus TaxID=30085 RepID=A0A0A9ZBV0_LYGHE